MKAVDEILFCIFFLDCLWGFFCETACKEIFLLEKIKLKLKLKLKICISWLCPLRGTVGKKFIQFFYRPYETVFSNSFDLTTLSGTIFEISQFKIYHSWLCLLRGTVDQTYQTFLWKSIVHVQHSVQVQHSFPLLLTCSLYLAPFLRYSTFKISGNYFDPCEAL